ncbi:PEP/pyruvate-binding domain-containing protein [Arthrobacter sp. NyZ413]|uniref:PEP/pyruvate-binding domain-containing protein n=1 Tax=Arthrobacter sp. NyZ413 TaxID=3144669 RepID=UPI003BF91BEC
MSQEYTLSLADPRATLENVGGKGASLARLAGWGLPVPDGFHVTCEAYRRFVADHDLGPSIMAALSAVDPSRPSSFEDASTVISGLFGKASMPREIAVAIALAYARLPEGAAVSVRSSATTEDLAGTSSAGQHVTLLNVRGEEELREAVVCCWASLWSARAISYRLEMGVDQRSASMGVVVQVLVASEVSGVLFTAHPATGDREELVLNASYGLGEAVVSGVVSPDVVVVDKASLAVKMAALGSKEVAVVAAKEGTATESVPPDRRGRLAITNQEIRDLGDLAVQVEKQSGGVPQDLEWAFAEGRCWLLQARPMTGLPPAPLTNVRWEPPIPGTKWIRRQVAENMPEPLSPLFEELYLGEGMELAMKKDMEMLGYPGAVADTGLPSYATVNGYAYLCASFTMNWRGLLKLLAALVGGKTMRATFVEAIPYWRDEVLPGHLKTVERWKGLDLASAPDQQLLDGICELDRSEAVYWGSTTLVLAAAKNSDAFLDRFLAIAIPGSGLNSALFLRGFPSKALEAEVELQAIARQIRASDELCQLARSTPARRLPDALKASSAGSVVAERLKLYLDRYGHQVYNLDFADPTQAENPVPVLLSLKTEVQQPGLDLRVRQAEIAGDRERLVQRTARSLDPLRRRLFLKFLRWAQSYAPYREEALFYIGSAWPVLRRLALDLGRRLVAAGSLHAPADVFYLQSGELRAASHARAAGQARPDLARFATERRELRESRRRLHPPAAVPPAARWKLGPLDLSGFETQKRNLGEGPSLKGFPVSPGRVTAPASVILSPGDFDSMMPDSILVCPTTIPAWTPLLAQAKGLVTDIGGVAAHGSIIAREYGIPAVMGTGNATQRIVSGQLVTVDGVSGTVTWTD